MSLVFLMLKPESVSTSTALLLQTLSEKYRFPHEVVRHYFATEMT
jgi:hypothetical protein